MKDRSVEFPNRYRLTKVAGTDDIFDLVPAPGDVTEEGTYINKATLLKDTTAALFGLDSKAVPDDVLNVLNTLVGTAQSTANTAKSAADTAQSTADARAKIATGSYTGTGTYGSANPCSLTFDFVPRVVLIWTQSNVAGYFYDGIFINGFDFLSRLWRGSGACSSALLSYTVADTTLSWYQASEAGHQFNVASKQYWYLGIG